MAEGTCREERDKEQSARHAATSSERHQEPRRHESWSLVTVQVERVGGDCDGNKGRRLWETGATSDPEADRSIAGRGRLCGIQKTHKTDPIYQQSVNQELILNK